MPALIDQCESFHGSLRVARHTPTTLLVVDDSLFEHRVIERLLKAMDGLRVVFASGGKEALELLERESPDMVLTDLMMPDMDGLELVQRVRDRAPAIPLILMTAYGSEEVAMRALRAGAANYIPKKDLARDLVDTVRRSLSTFVFDRRRQQLLRCLTYRESFFVLDNDPELAASLLGLILEELDGLGVLDRTTQVRIGVALQEALTNALYHGNLEVSSDLRQEDERLFYELAESRRGQDPYRTRRIKVLSRIDREAATFVIQDEGPGFDVAEFKEPIDLDDLTRIGGRGLLLIRTFMDEVAFNTTGNEITMTKRFRAAAPPSGQSS